MAQVTFLHRPSDFTVLLAQITKETVGVQLCGWEQHEQSHKEASPSWHGKTERSTLSPSPDFRDSVIILSAYEL